METSCNPIVTKPKPKPPEPPKDEAAAEKKPAEGEAPKTGEAQKTEGNSAAGDTKSEEKMEEDPSKGEAEDMELD